jgi:DNA-binding transcriptional MerR regulator/methylmalonyl-CoA mutase cobalamin-binding subunit
MEWHPIRVVARRTGLSAHVIRAWERRYGAVEPKRTKTERRVYSTEDLERLLLLRRATLGGRSIGQIAKLSNAELKRIVEEDEAATARVEPSPRLSEAPRARAALDGSEFLKAAMDAAGRLDTAELVGALDRASVALSRPALMEQVIVPLMQRIGDAWRDGSLRVAHEHLASAIVRSFVGNLNGAFNTPSLAPAMVVTTPAGQLHEIGALLAAAAALSDGWRVTYLGPSLPASEIAAAVAQTKASVVALSVIYPTDDPHLQTEFQKLARLVGPKVRILVGGRGGAAYRGALDAIGAVYLPDYSSFRGTLDSIRLGNEA